MSSSRLSSHTILATTLLALAAPQSLRAGWQAAFPPYQTGFPFAFSVADDNSLVNGSSVAVADLNGDQVPELIVGTKDGRVMAYRTNGVRLWVYPPAGNLGMGIDSKPGIADIDNDGFPEVVVSMGSTFTPSFDGRLLVLSHTGALQCQFLPNTTVTPFRDGVYASPALVELNAANPGLEIAVGFWDGWFRVLRSNCTVIWESHLRDSIWSSPSIVDLDGNGQLDIVFGSDSHAEGPPTNTLDGGILRAFRGDGSGELTGFPIQFDEVLYSSPAVGDITGDGLPEIVIGTGRCWDVPACSVPPGNTHPNVGEYLLAIDRFGNPVPGWPVAIPGRYSFSSPALADLDGDGDLEAIFRTIGKTANDSLIEVRQGDGSSMSGFPKMPTVPAGCGGSTVSTPTSGSPIAVDVTGNGFPEILIGVNNDIVVVDRFGNQLSRASGCSYPSGTYLLLLETSAIGTPTAADLDGDGDVEIVFGAGSTFGASNSAGALYAWDFPAPFPSADYPWTQFRHDVRNLGRSRPELFGDGFESGDLSAWSTSVP